MELVRNDRLESLYGIAAWGVGGTPVDGIKLYLEELGKDKQPDVVLSGINNGANLATDILYSGTVGAAREGFLHDIPSFAVSLDVHSEITADEAAGIFKAYLEKTMAGSTHPFLYNINFPKSFRGRQPEFLFSRQGRRDYLNAFIREERDGRVFYSVAGEIYDTDKSEATDIYATEQGFISVTPLITDLTDYQLLDEKLSV
jgi:5'-nucleotidase